MDYTRVVFHPLFCPEQPGALFLLLTCSHIRTHIRSVSTLEFVLGTLCPVVVQGKTVFKSMENLEFDLKCAKI